MDCSLTPIAVLQLRLEVQRVRSELVLREEEAKAALERIQRQLGSLGRAIAVADDWMARHPRPSQEEFKKACREVI